jgi:hypothetical protein
MRASGAAGTMLIRPVKARNLAAPRERTLSGRQRLASQGPISIGW